MGKVIITGTGRCGSSFLVHLLSALGMDTGYTEDYCFNELKNECRGGCEWAIDKPYRILKNPEFATKIDSIIKSHKIDHVIIPIRDLMETALSREQNNNNHGRYGGFWMGAKSINEQADKHADLIYFLIEQLTIHEIPFTTIHFPRMIDDSNYLRRKLLKVFKSATDYNIIARNFYPCFGRVADPSKITI